MRVTVTVPWGERLGGAEAMLQGILEGEGEAADGAEFELIFLEDGEWPGELRARGVHVDVVPAGRLRQPHRYAAAVARIRRILRERRPDVLLNWSGKTHVYGSPAALLAGMSDRVAWWQHGFPHGRLDQLATWLPAVAVGCTSDAVARLQALERPVRRTFTVHAGTPIPPEEPRPAGLALPEGVPVVGLVGRLQPWKGQDRLLRAQRILRDRGLDVHTLIVGGDSYELSPEYAASLEPLARELGIAGAVTMTGEVPDAGPYVRAMDVLVNASDREPFGIVILEAMARGVAVVAVDAGGPAELVEDGVTGMLARSDEPEALADALARLVGAPDVRARVALAGQEQFRREYTNAAMRARLIARLRELFPRA
ncbi:MAG TPA: glycosyltransferase family 4 protein [Solirubrobacteraceae bacterium]|jgi:glycosyltransferase involved in cell wall biosynthesis|nr:glycosyltransferase family 4 protein [Solirubrobacteraceae bacterium]